MTKCAEIDCLYSWTTIDVPDVSIARISRHIFEVTLFYDRSGFRDSCLPVAYDPPLWRSIIRLTAVFCALALGRLDARHAFILGNIFLTAERND